MSKGGKKGEFLPGYRWVGTEKDTKTGAGKIAFEKRKNAEDRGSSEKCICQSWVRQADSTYIKNYPLLK